MAQQNMMWRPDTTGRNKVDWDEVAAIVQDAFRLVAPKSLVAELDTA